MNEAGLLSAKLCMGHPMESDLTWNIDLSHAVMCRGSHHGQHGLADGP
jgi:hypothetical protein